MGKDNKSITIGLVFPELGKHDYNYFTEILDREKNRLDMIVFPEGYETITPMGKDITPESVKNDRNVKSLLRRYSSISHKYNVGVIVGFQVDYKNKLISGGENDQYCAYISPHGDNYIYHKHSSSKFKAFFDSNWSIENNLKTVQIKDVNIGISICHDSYISLISRLLAKKGADIWVNISYQNVPPKKWESIHLTRAVENNFISLCTLHRNSHKRKNRQNEPYAFSPVGKIRLKDLQTNKYIDEFPKRKRTGKIYFFDTKEHQVIPFEPPYESGLSAHAVRMPIREEHKMFSLNKYNSEFSIKKITLGDYLSPEVLWKHSLQQRDKTTIFIVRTHKREWDAQRVNVLKTITGRTIEFSTAFVFVDGADNILLSAYMSSSYKACRIFYPDGFPITIDKRYLKGIASTFKISLDDDRNEDDILYFERVKKIIETIDSL